LTQIKLFESCLAAAGASAPPEASTGAEPRRPLIQIKAAAAVLDILDANLVDSGPPSTAPRRTSQPICKDFA
jgi:hypothetical protein